MKVESVQVGGASWLEIDMRRAEARECVLYINSVVQCCTVFNKLGNYS